MKRVRSGDFSTTTSLVPTGSEGLAIILPDRRRMGDEIDRRVSSPLHQAPVIQQPPAAVKRAATFPPAAFVIDRRPAADRQRHETRPQDRRRMKSRASISCFPVFLIKIL